MPGAVAIRCGRRNVGESPGQVVPEEDTQRFTTVRRMRDGINPRADDERLQEETRVELRSPQLRPAPLPGNECEKGQPRYQPSGRTLRHEADCRAGVHQKIAVELSAAWRGRVAEIRPQE